MLQVFRFAIICSYSCGLQMFARTLFLYRNKMIWCRQSSTLTRKINQVGAIVAICVVSALDESVHHKSEAFSGLIGETVVADVVQLDAGIAWNFHAALYSDVVIEHIINAEGCGKVILHMVSDLVCGIAVARAVLAHICSLIGCVVGRLTLEEIGSPVFTVPQRLVLLEVLVEKAIHCHIVAIHHQSVGRCVDVPSHTASDAMIGSPNPKVVADDIVAVDDNT